MASGRSYHIRYGSKGAYKPKVRPGKSPTEELFDRLIGKGSTDSSSKQAAPTSSARSETKAGKTSADENSEYSPCSESPVRTRERPNTYFEVLYNFSRSPRKTSPVMSQCKASDKSLAPSSTLPTSLTATSLPQQSSPGSLSDDNSKDTCDAGEKKQDKKNREALKVFDFDVSSDEGNLNEAKKSFKKVKVNEVKPVAESRKQTSLRQYSHCSDIKQVTGGSDKKVTRKVRVAKNRKLVNAKAISDVSAKNGQKAADSDVRSTISKMLASKAQMLQARAQGQTQVEQNDQSPQPDVMPSKPDPTEVTEESVGSISRRVKRKVVPSAATVATKRAPPKRAKIEKINPSELLPTSHTSVSDKTGSSSAVKKNGINGSGTLEMSDIATRTRASRRELTNKGKSYEERSGCKTPELGDDTAPRPVQPASPEGGNTQSCHESEFDLTGSSRASVTSTPESTRGGRPSPRYTARGRRMSNLGSPTHGTGTDGSSSGYSFSARLTFTTEGGASTHTSRDVESDAHSVISCKAKSDPYGFDSEKDTRNMDKSPQKNRLLQPKPSLRKSSSATSYMPTSAAEPSSAQPSTSSWTKLPTSQSDQYSQYSTTAANSSRGNLLSGMKVDPLVPSLKKSSSWPQRPAVATRSGDGGRPSSNQRTLSKSSLVTSSAGGSSAVSDGQITCPREEKQLYTVVRNVRQAHECLEIGESQQFFDEVHYLLDSIKPSQPLSVRCLGAFNLCTHYFDSEFNRQLRAHSFTPRITALLKDCLQHPTLCLSAAVLFYVMTRDKLNTEWDNNGAALLVGMLSKEEPFFTSELSTGKAQREMTKLRSKAKTILQKVKEQTSQSPEPSSSPRQEEPVTASVAVSSSEVLVKSGVEGARRGDNKTDILKEKPHHVNVENVSVQELVCECLISLTHHQHNPQWLRHQLRLLGGLDLLANLVISSIDEISSVDVSTLPLSSHSPSDYVSEIGCRLVTLERRLKALEHATVRNKDNQSYLVVFDGSVLLSKIVRLVALFQNLTKHDILRPISEHCLLTAFKVLLNLTHELQLGCYRLGEQKDIMTIILYVLFQLSVQMSDEDTGFDITVLALSLLINLTEMCSSNRTLLEGTKLPWVDSNLSGSQESTISNADIIYDNDSSMKVLVQLFLERFSKAESTQIQVPTPQRLSQLTSSSTPHASPSKQESQPSTSKRDLFSAFTSKVQKSSLTGSQSSNTEREEVLLSQDGGRSQPEGGTKWLDKESAADESKSTRKQSGSDSEEEEALEKVDIDPLVFSREEFDAALHQAGRHMEDSIIAAYTALLLGILSKHNQDTLVYVRSLMPSQSFSEMIEILKKLVSFMNMTGSATGLESIKHVVKYLEAL